MLDFEKIAEITYITLELGEVVMLDNGLVMVLSTNCQNLKNLLNLHLKRNLKLAKL